MSPRQRTDAATDGGALNMIPFASMAGGWLGPLLMFWLYVWGPLRPFAYPSGDLLPGAIMAAALLGCIATWWLLPARYFDIRRFERTGRIYEVLGIRLFRQLVPDGDLANRLERRKNPRHRVIGSLASARAFVTRTEQSERGHIVFLLLGIVSALHAVSIGWHGWAIYLTAGNIIVNLYPILLQRYTRGRLESVLRRGGVNTPRE